MTHDTFIEAPFASLLWRLSNCGAGAASLPKFAALETRQGSGSDSRSA